MAKTTSSEARKTPHELAAQMSRTNTNKRHQAAKRARRAAYWKAHPSEHVNHPARKTRRGKLMLKHLSEHGLPSTDVLKVNEDATPLKDGTVFIHSGQNVITRVQ